MAAHTQIAALTLTLFLLLCTETTISQVLTPPYFNLAVSRQIEATSTCGQGVLERELFCKLTGANPGRSSPNLVTKDYEVIQGQLCDFCDNSDPSKIHPPEYAIDGTERWWQSPPLSRGLELNKINLTINLGQTFHVAYVFIKMGNSPRPGVFVLERSIDNGLTWNPWQYFAETVSDCNTFFGQDNYVDYITADDSVVCTTSYSKVVPLEGGEIVVSLVNNRPSANNFSYSQTLQDWTKATNVRLRLLRTKTLLGHLMAVARQDPTVTRRYYYSIKDISIGGRCVCNGHADVCDKTDPLDQYKLLCRCQHNTCGDQCQQCCEGYVQKPWRPATLQDINECEPCQCYGHSRECTYDEDVADSGTSLDINGVYEGGGVCQNCGDNTMGVNCEKCRPGYFRPAGVALDARDVCQPCRCDPFFSTGECEEGTGRCLCKAQYAGDTCEECDIGFYGWPNCLTCDCNVNGTMNQVCEVGGGQCPCKPNYEGVNCDQCAYGYYGFPDCKRCECDAIGSLSDYCEPSTGQCTCRTNYGDRDCSGCARGYYNYPTCDLCTCDPSGTTSDICDQDLGTCMCRENFGGSRCEQCARGYFSYPDCIECGCAEPGANVDECDESGQCVCNYNYAGRLCGMCAPGYYKYPECLPCECSVDGSYGVSCDQETGQCDCMYTFEGLMCNKCKPNFYNYPICEECNCNPAGAKEVPGYPLGGCGAKNDGSLCECKERVTGRICDTCLSGYWSLKANNPFGCEGCNCYTPGTTGSSHVCNTVSGQCFCKPYVTNRRCDTCADGTYQLQEHTPFGCIDCGCNVGGSDSMACDKDTGQCECRPRINGRNCDNPIAAHYFPTLYHHMYEMEDGRTKEGGRVRYGFDDQAFHDFSWRGYAIFSRLQDEVLVDLDIKQPSLYRIIFRFVNPTDDRITADVTLTPEASTADVEQGSTVVFQPGRNPQFVTVSGGGIVTPFVLNPGRWTISLKTAQQLYVDYVVLLPQSYYEGTILQEIVNTPCSVPGSEELCKHYMYVDVSSYSMARGESGYIRVGSDRERTQIFPDKDITDELGANNMALIDNSQPSMFLNLPVPRPGRYVLVMLYHSSASNRLHEMDIEVASPGAREEGKLKLHSCPYSSLCRQVVTDQDGNLREFEIDGSYASLTITGLDGITVAIDSMIAVPVQDWNLEIIHPRLKCIKQNQKCIPSSFYNPTGAIQVEVESGPNEDLVTEDIPPNIIDTSIKVIKLDRNLPTVSVKASVINPGRYVLIAHYYQPYSVGFDVDVEVLINGIVSKGYLHADYCPSDSGCRSVIQFDDAPDMQVLDLVDLDFILAFNSTSGRPLWLDYIVVVSADQFSRDVLNVQGVDKAGEFISKCGQNDFYISPSTSGFCRDSVYSLTTYYNNGAMECNCNTDGSVSFSCDQFGGQCRCRPNVIGRTCSQCKTGYFGFPNCRPCNCPSGLCDQQTGQCVCPPRVTGPNCNICLPRTFGYDPFIGCEECNCNRMGVLNNDMDCNVEDGQCSCKPNIAGRRCDMCVAGYYGYPRCLECSCDTSGTTDDICDQDTAECLCKENVEGPQCSQCRPSTFYLEERSPTGCSTCFCFSISSTCDSSTYRRSQVSDMEGWGITNLIVPETTLRGNTIEARVTSDNIMNEEIPIYWVAPLPYLGNKITAYGGKLLYTVRFRLPRDRETNGIVDPDVRIEGNNSTIVWISPEQPAAGTPLVVELDMLESEFIHELTGATVSREQFMMVLQNIDALQIRGSFYTQVSQVRLSDVSLDIASPDGTGALARNVEQCQCPANYRGTSCEECADGYYRSKTGPYLGVCVPCNCNNKADRCDPESGECINCRDNYSGPQCLSCLPGHFQDRYSGTCMTCSCPLPVQSNNFASTCEVASDGSMHRCLCDEGYAGRQCEQCDLGHWGNPSELGGMCRPCACSENIDLRDPMSCDIVTGECLRCINNSTGERCERCDDWFWGDAITEKNCRSCTCNLVGSERCDYRTGACMCKPNVVGPDCDRCQDGAFGFESGLGCDLCDCAVGAYGSDCDITTGQCSCRPGVTGRRCDQCERGYWNYGTNGCETCRCEFEGATTCDPLTGRCECLPGVTGPKCDSCLPRWVLIPEQGCEECDNCIHLLLDDAVIIDHNVTSMIEELESVSVGQGAIRKLENINDTVKALRPRVEAIITDPTDPILLDPLKEEFIKMARRTNEVRNKADRAIREAELVEDDAADTKLTAEGLDELITMASDMAEEAVAYAKEVLEEILSGIEDKNVGELLRQAELILQEIRERDFNDAKASCEQELEKALEVLERVQELHSKAVEQANRTATHSLDLGKVFEKLQDLMNNSRHSLDNSQAGFDLTSGSRRLLDEIKSLIEQIKYAQEETEMCLEKSQDLLSNATQFLQDAKDAFADMEAESTKLDAAMDQLRDYVEQLGDENRELRPLVDNATAHAYKLRQQAELLESLISDTKDSASGALNASHAYQAIVDAINRAKNSSMAAIDTAGEATLLSEGLADRARVSRETSEQLKGDADDTAQSVDQELRPRLVNAITKTDQVSELNTQTKSALTDILLGLEGLPLGGYSQEAQEAANKAIDAQQKAETARNRIQDILMQLPQDQITVEDIPRMVEEANRNVYKAQGSVEKVIELVPQATELLDRLSVSAERVNNVGLQLTGNITALRDQIQVARDQSNLIEVGMTFMADSTLQVRNPVNMDQAGSYSKISMFFKTKSSDGFLAYVGPDMFTQQPDEDYLALEIVNGLVMFRYDLGGGPGVITNDKNVTDGKWHEVIAERTGKTATLTIRTADEEDVTADGVSPDTYAVLDLHPHNSKFYIGGVPSGAGLENLLTSQRFDGGIENVNFGGVPIGLWNFNKGGSNTGCRARDELTGSTAKGFRFDGTGYVIVEKQRFRPGNGALVKITFNTFAANGLLFVMGEEKDFYSIELKDGTLVFQFDLGSGPAILQSSKTFNDGQWHTVTANRLGKDGLLRVDEVTEANGRSSGSMKELAIADEIFIGGYKGMHNYPDVTQVAFDGCIKDVTLGSATRDINNDNIEAKGVLPGCPQMARVVSFTPEAANSYLELQSLPDGIHSDFEMTMKIKTQQEDGLLFYTSDDSPDQINSFSVSLVEGKIVVVTVSEGSRTVLETDTSSYSDGAWHYITTNKGGKNLQVSVDDLDTVKTRMKGKKDILTTKPMYLGGVPGMFNIVPENVGTDSRFVGCVGDVTINGASLNFAKISPDAMVGLSLAGCPIMDPEDASDIVTIPPPKLPDATLPPDNGEVAQCVLPREPVDSRLGVGAEGTRYGTQPDSRTEYTKLPDSVSLRSDFSVEFKTTSRDGVIFYTSNAQNVDFVGLYMKNGQLIYAFNCGSGTATIMSDRTYNDGEWHKVVFSRDQKNGQMFIDDTEETLEGESEGSTTSLNVEAPYYLGGLDPVTSQSAVRNLDDVTNGFIGCLRNMMLNSADIGEPSLEVATVPCSSDVEVGTFFYADGGYLTLKDDFFVGLDLDIYMDIRPRSLSGVLLSVYNLEGDYLILQLVNGEVVFSVNNGDAEIETRHTPTVRNEICNGEWHTIKAVKAKNVVTLTVDSMASFPGIGAAGVSETNTNDPLYLGGLPESHLADKTGGEQYVGCIRNVKLGTERQNLALAPVTGTVSLNTCPTN